MIAHIRVCIVMRSRQERFMSAITFYTNPMSRGRIVRWMLEEIGVEIQDRPRPDGPPPELPPEIRSQLDDAMGEMFRQRLTEALGTRKPAPPEEPPGQ